MEGSVWSLSRLFRPRGGQPHPLWAGGLAAGVMASDNEPTFIQGDGHSSPPLPQPLPLCHSWSLEGPLGLWGTAEQWER